MTFSASWGSLCSLFPLRILGPVARNLIHVLTLLSPGSSPTFKMKLFFLFK